MAFEFNQKLMSIAKTILVVASTGVIIYVVIYVFASQETMISHALAQENATGPEQQTDHLSESNLKKGFDLLHEEMKPTFKLYKEKYGYDVSDEKTDNQISGLAEMGGMTREEYERLFITKVAVIEQKHLDYALAQRDYVRGVFRLNVLYDTASEEDQHSMCKDPAVLKIIKKEALRCERFHL